MKINSVCLLFIDIQKILELQLANSFDLLILKRTAMMKEDRCPCKLNERQSIFRLGNLQEYQLTFFKNLDNKKQLISPCF